jgi:diacylglycerol kinase family enzyme
VVARSGEDFELPHGVNVSILYSRDAGHGISGDNLRDLVESGGHSVLEIVTAERLEANGSRRRPDSRSEVLVAAGGDGTVALAAHMVAGSSTPLAILPLGTANNIAKSLRIGGSPGELIASWNNARRVPFDLAHAQASSSDWLVVEGAGAGLIPSGIAAAQRAQGHHADGGTAAPAAALQMFYSALVKLEPRHWTMVVDGKRFSEDFLLVEVLNIPSVGPNLVLAEDATPSDGLLDVVVARAEHRKELLTYLQGRIEGRETSVSLPRWRAREIRIESCDEFHIDDESVNTCQLGHLSIRIQPGAITMLT